VDVASLWLVSGVVAIGVGLAVWWTAFVLFPVGVVLLVMGITKSLRSTLRARSR
jgi:membrane protein implicated in regulation of membrane protease activity